MPNMRRVLACMILSLLIISLTTNVLIYARINDVGSYISGKSNEYRAHIKNSSEGKGDQSTIFPRAEETAEEFNLKKLIDYILSLRTDYGAFPLRTSGDPYANATFYGIYSLYLVGRLEDISKRNLSTFLKLLYNEENGGFRDWLGGNTSVKATAYALMIMNLTRITFDEFNRSLTEHYLLNHIVENGIIEEEKTKPDLYTTVLGTLALYFLSSNITNYESLIDAILGYYEDGLFEDNSTRVSNLIETFFAVKTLSLLNKSIITMKKENIIQAMLSELLYRGENSSWIGFGEREPTVFETGVATDILLSLGYKNETLQHKIVAFVNNSQDETGGINKSPKVRGGKDIFQAFGAVLIYYLTQGFKPHLFLGHEIKPGEQVAIDYNGTIEIRFKIYLMGNDLDYFNVTYHLWPKDEYGKMIFDNVSEYLTTFVPKILGFGNFTLNITASQGFILFAQQIYSHVLSFRVGYNLNIGLSSKKLRPGESLAINITVTFANGSFPEEGAINAAIYYNNYKVFENTTTMKNESIIMRWNIPKDAALGYYIIRIFVNDSHGSNHTFWQNSILLNDSLVINFEGIREEYHLGENISLSFTLSFESSKAEIPMIPNVTLELSYWEGRWLTLSGIWKSQGELWINGSLPTALPPSKNFTVFLRLEWQKNFVHQYKIFVLNISISDLVVKVLDRVPDLVIGDQVILSTELIANTTGARIDNASITLEIVKENISWQIVKLTYNSSERIYFSNFTVNPNIPAGEASIHFRLYVPYNNSWIFLRLYSGENKIIVQVTGSPVLRSLKRPEVFYVDEEAIIDLIIECNVTRKLLQGLTLIANISRNGEAKIIELFEIEPGVYRLLFKPWIKGSYSINIKRASDDLLITSLTIIAKEKRGVFAQFFQMYGTSIIGGIIVGLMLLYAFVMSYFGGKVPKRYLLRKKKKG